MRRVRNNTTSENTFDQGIQQIIRDKVARPTDYRDYELNAIVRKEQFEATRIPQKTPERGYSVSDLMQELAWSKPVTAA